MIKPTSGEDGVLGVPIIVIVVLLLASLGASLLVHGIWGEERRPVDSPDVGEPPAVTWLLMEASPPAATRPPSPRRRCS